MSSHQFCVLCSVYWLNNLDLEETTSKQLRIMHVNFKNIKKKVGCSLYNLFIEICSLILYMLLQKSTNKCCFRI